MGAMQDKLTQVNRKIDSCKTLIVSYKDKKKKLEKSAGDMATQRMSEASCDAYKEASCDAYKKAGKAADDERIALKPRADKLNVLLNELHKIAEDRKKTLKYKTLSGYKQKVADAQALAKGKGKELVERLVKLHKMPIFEI